MPRGIDRYDEALQQGRLWNPRNDGLAVWYDAEDIGTITCDGSGKVSEWRDKSGNANNATQGTAGQRPTFQAASVFGKPGILFVRSSSTNLGFTTLATGDTTVSIAWRHTVSANPKTLFCRVSGSGAHQCRCYGDQLAQSVNFVVDVQTAPSGPAAPVNHVSSWRSSSGGGTWLMRDDGIQYTTTNSTTITSGQNGIGISNGGDNLDGVICEILCSLGKATDYEIIRREGYLAWKWGFVARLRGNHPFNNRPPLIGD
jgi:hypothetical protein